MKKIIFNLKFNLLNDKEILILEEKRYKIIFIIFLKIIILYLLLSFKNVNSFVQYNLIEIDNKINETLYENDFDFSKYETNIKAIAIYFPQFIYFKDHYNYNNMEFNEWEFIRKVKPLFIGHHQPRNQDKNYFNFEIDKYSKTDFIKKQIKLAKNHGIYGFGIIYYWFSGKKLFDEPVNIFLKKEINFPFFLIWKNNKYELNSLDKNENIIIENKYNYKEAFMFIVDTKKYFISKNYIKIKKKPILAIYEPLLITNLKGFLSSLRKNAKNLGINNIFIYGVLNENKDLNYTKLFDYCFEFPPKNIKLNELQKNKNYFYYAGLRYRENNNYTNLKIYRGVMLEWDNTTENKNSIIFNEYSPEKFYLITKLIINLTKNEINKNNKFIFINGWNNWKEGSYLEPDDKYGFSSLNALSKALFNLSYRNNKYNLKDLINNCRVAVQIHIFYKDLILDIINKTNNIPIKFDLFISTISFEIKNNIKKYIIQYSKANIYEIIILENKGRDVLPLLTQLKNKIKQYKYILHIHSKKSLKNPIIGFSWRNYLYNNLIGNKRIVSEILTDFENNGKLGFIFPETFYYIIKERFKLTKKTLKYMKYILKKLFPNSSPGILVDFPAGNMFWARTNAIFQIFEFNFNINFDREKDQTNDTIMHGIERIWLYLVKINGFYYKTIFKSLD